MANLQLSRMSTNTRKVEEEGVAFVSFLCCDSKVLITSMLFAGHIMAAKSHSNSECKPFKCIYVGTLEFKEKWHGLNAHVHCLN